MQTSKPPPQSASVRHGVHGGISKLVQTPVPDPPEDGGGGQAQGPVVRQRGAWSSTHLKRASHWASSAQLAHTH